MEVLISSRLRIIANLEFNMPSPYHAMTKYWNRSSTDREMETAWEAIDTNYMAVTLDDTFAEGLGLPMSTRFPWDTERSIYYIKGVHDLHCLVRALALLLT